MIARFDHLLLSNQELLSIKGNFVTELRKAAQGEKTSIPYISYQVALQSPLQDGEIFQVMTIGGSVFKSALVKKEGTIGVILEERQDAVPTFSTEKLLLHFFEKNLDLSVSYLALNFAYPLKPSFHDGLLDCILLSGTKGGSFTGLIGKEVGTTLQAYILDKYKKKIQITVANDTVCLFLSQVTKQTWETTVGGIIGTGSNYAIGVADKVVDLECGGFDKFTRTPTGIVIDRNSLNQGYQFIEKEIAGIYLYQHFNIIAQEYNLNTVLSSTKELSNLAQKNDGDASTLAQIILKRSASFAACQIAGIVKFLSSRHPETPLCHPDESRDPARNYIDPVSRHGMTYAFVMEGSLFWEGYQYKTFLETYLQQLGVKNKIIFSPTRHHSIKGAIELLIPG